MGTSARESFGFRSGRALRIAAECLLAGVMLRSGEALASDPPHTNDCSQCHMTHHAPGGALTSVVGNPNLCVSCHMPGGSASGKPFVSSDQALPWPGLPAGFSGTGSSHRWDSGPSGHVDFLGGAVTSSTGRLQPDGVFTGVYAKTYTITIANAGTVGTARFNWVATAPGGGAGTNLLTSAGVPLDGGISLSFVNGTGTSFQANDRWNLYVRTDVRQTTNSVMLLHMTNGVAYCSLCHDQHLQVRTPFDSAAPFYDGPGTGEGRHFMRIDNDACQMCNDCHAARNVTNALAGSHPVGLGADQIACTFCHDLRAPPNSQSAPLGPNHEIECLTCHQVHYSPTANGALLRASAVNLLCTKCHPWADATTPAAHLVTTNNNALWPGGQYGSLLPARTDVAARGSCLNCHPVHGWPDAANPAGDYPVLLADREENLCFTCHDADGPAAKRVRGDFLKTRHHPVADSQQSAGRSVECTDCHNEHTALSGASVYTNTATATRNRVSNPLKGASGVSVNYTGLGNFVAPALNNYAAIPETTGATYEYQVCFKCHSGYAWLPGSPPNGLSPNGSVTNPVQTDLAQEFSSRNRSGHPVVTGLDNYPNSLTVGGKKGLLAAALTAPWKVNIGQQTMMCSDCHNTDAASPAAQGPHGSAAQFMLRGANANNWPNVTLANFASSWCANCHIKNGAGRPHTEGDHDGTRCYACHIVIPHGGKVSRLIGDRDTMPARYAYNSDLTTMQVRSFLKYAANSYEKNACQTACTSEHSSGGSENW